MKFIINNIMFDDRGIVAGVHIVHLENDRLAAGLEQAPELGLAR